MAGRDEIDPWADGSGLTTPSIYDKWSRRGTSATPMPDNTSIPYDLTPPRTNMLRWKIRLTECDVRGEIDRQPNPALCISLKSSGLQVNLPDARIKKALDDNLLWYEHPEEAPHGPDILLVAAVPYDTSSGQEMRFRDPRHVWNSILRRLLENPDYCNKLGNEIGVRPDKLRTGDVSFVQSIIEAGCNALFHDGYLTPTFKNIHVLVYVTQALRLAVRCWSHFGKNPVPAEELKAFIGSEFPELRWGEIKADMHPNAYIYIDGDGVPMLEYPEIDENGIASMRGANPYTALVTEEEMARAVGGNGKNLKVRKKQEVALRNYMYRKYMVPTSVSNARNAIMQQETLTGTRGYDLDDGDAADENDGGETEEAGGREFLASASTRSAHGGGNRDGDAPTSQDNVDSLIQYAKEAVETIIGPIGAIPSRLKGQTPVSGTQENTPSPSRMQTTGDVEMEDADDVPVYPESPSLVGSTRAPRESATRKSPATEVRAYDTDTESEFDEDDDEDEDEDSPSRLTFPRDVLYTEQTKRFRPRRPAADYVPEMEDQVPAALRLDVTVEPIYDQDDKPAALKPPFVLVSVEHMLGSDIKWEWLLKAHPEYADNLSRLGVMLPWELETVRIEGSQEKRRHMRDQVDITSPQCMRWLQDPDLKGKLASHSIFLPARLPLDGSPETGPQSLHIIRRRMLLQARDYICEMEVQDANLLNNEDDIDPADVPQVNFSFDIFRGQKTPLPRIALRRIVNFLKDSDVDRTIGWKTAVGELREYLDHLLPMSRGMKWADKMREAANLLTVHEVFEDYFYGQWDFPLGVRMVERKVRLKAPKGAPLLRMEKPNPRAELPPPPRLLEREPVPVSDVMYGRIQDKKTELYPYLRVLASHESAMWRIPIRGRLTREAMDKWLLEHHRKNPALNPLGINASMAENDVFEKCIMKGPSYTVKERKTFVDPKNDMMLDPLLKLATVRGNLRAGLQQCLRQIDHWPLKHITTPWCRVNFPTQVRRVGASEDAGHVFNAISMHPDQLSDEQKRDPFIWTKSMILHGAELKRVAESARYALDATSARLHDIAICPAAKGNGEAREGLVLEAEKQAAAGEEYADQLKLDEEAEEERKLRLAPGPTDEDQPMQDAGSSVQSGASTETADLAKYPVRLPPNFRGPFLYSQQKILHEAWMQKVRQLEGVYPILKRAYERSPRSLLHACLEQIHYGKMTTVSLARTRLEALNKERERKGEPPVLELKKEDIEEARKTVDWRYGHFMDVMNDWRETFDMEPCEDAREKAHQPFVTRERDRPKLVTDENVKDLLLLAERSRVVESATVLEPQHPLFLNFWDRLESVMYSTRADNPWTNVNSRVSVEKVVELVNKGPGSGTESCGRFQFARSDVLNYVERLHAQHKIYYERDLSIVGGWVLLPDTPEVKNTTIHPEARFVWNLNTMLTGFMMRPNLPDPVLQRNVDRMICREMEYPSEIEDWDATMHAYEKWKLLKAKADKEGKPMAGVVGTNNFLVAPDTVDYLLSASYRLGYTIRVLKKMLRKAPGVPSSFWGAEKQNEDHLYLDDDDVEMEEDEDEEEEKVPDPQLDARLDAWEAAVQQDPRYRTLSLQNVVKRCDPARWHADMTEPEARDLIRFKLVEEAQKNHTMLWPGSQVIYEEEEGTKARKVAVKRESIWDWAHPAGPHGNCGRKFFHLDKWPLEVAPPEAKTAMMGDRDVDERLLFNPLKGDIPADREHYRPVVYKRIGQGDHRKHVPGMATFVAGDTPRQKKFIESRISTMINPRALENYVRSSGKKNPALAQALGLDRTRSKPSSPGDAQPTESRQSGNAGAGGSSRAEGSGQPATTTRASSGDTPATPDNNNNASGGSHRKQPSAIIRLLNSTFRKPWLQNPLPPADPDAVPKSLDPEEAQTKIRELEAERAEEELRQLEEEWRREEEEEVGEEKENEEGRSARGGKGGKA